MFNPGGEEDVQGWIVTEGYMESLEEYVCDGIEPYNGNYYFIVGALCNTATYAEAYQEVDVSEYNDCIEQNLAYVHYGGYLSDWGGSDHPEMAIAFIDENGYEIERTDNIGTYNSFWTYFYNEYQIPIDTKSIQMILMGTRYAGDDNDSYFDDLFLKIWQNESCLNLLGDLNNDSTINILDIIVLINIVLGESPTDYQEEIGDVNQDGIINVLDIILVVNIILNR